MNVVTSFAFGPKGLELKVTQCDVIIDKLCNKFVSFTQFCKTDEVLQRLRHLEPKQGMLFLPQFNKEGTEQHQHHLQHSHRFVQINYQETTISYTISDDQTNY